MAAVERTDDGGVCRLRLNRPDKLNALNEDVRSALAAAFDELRDRPDIKVVVLEGEGTAFSAGADLSGSGLGRGGSVDWATRRHVFGSWGRLLDVMETVPQVTVAKLHHHVIGGASLLAVACDLRIAADDVKIRIPELAIGIPLTWGGVPRLAREIGLPLARDLVLTGRTMLADEARACGFVQRVAPRAALEDATDALVAELVAMPAAPLAITRAMFTAIGRERTGAAGWADPDLLMWSGMEPESRDAAVDYVSSRLAKGS